MATRRLILHELPDNPYRLGRNLSHDTRSVEGPFRFKLAVTPKSVKWTRRVPIFDQGQLRSCTGNAAAGWIGTDNILRQGLTAEGGVPVDEALAVDIYSKATVIDPYKGSYPPTDTGSDGLSVAKVLQKMGLIDVYQHVTTLDDMLAALQLGSVMVGSVWLDQMFDTDASGLVTVAGSVAGGHEYLRDEVDMENEILWGPNSWGPGWGKAGRFGIRFADMETLLKQDGDCTVPHALVATPTPTPTPVPVHHRSIWEIIVEWFESLGR